MKELLLFSLFAAGLLFSFGSSCASQKTDPQKTETKTETNAGPGRPNPPEKPGADDRPENNPPPGHVQPAPPKPLENVPKDCQDKAKATNGVCPRLYAPVCGCNNITYTNECLARRDGVMKWVEGVCK